MLRKCGCMSECKKEYIVLIVVKSERSRVESKDYPAVGEMKVDGFDPGSSLEHFLLDLEAQGHSIKYLITLGCRA